jgi:hypothetical protein
MSEKLVEEFKEIIGEAFLMRKKSGLKPIADNPEMERSIKGAVKKAETKFWEEISKNFKEIKTGDLAPKDALALELAMQDAVVAWVNANFTGK